MRCERHHALKLLEVPVFVKNHQGMLLGHRGDEQIGQWNAVLQRAELGELPLRSHGRPLCRGRDGDDSEHGESLVQDRVLGRVSR